MSTRTPIVVLTGSWMAATISMVALAQSGPSPVGGPFQFTPLATSTACVVGGAGAYPAEQPFVLPAGFVQTVIAREGDGGAPITST